MPIDFEAAPQIDFEPSKQIDFEPIGPPSPTPATDKAVANTGFVDQSNPEQYYKPQDHPAAEAVAKRVLATMQGAGIPTTLEEAKGAAKFLMRSPVQDVTEIYQDITKIPERIRNFKETIQGSPAATVVRDPLSPEAFQVYGTAAGLLAPAVIKGLKDEPVARPEEPPATSIPPEQQNASTGVAKAQEGASGAPIETQPTTEGTTNAQQITETAQSNGSVQQPQVTPENAPLPTDEGSQGVQGRGQGNVVDGEAPQAQGNDVAAVTSDEPHVSTIANRFTQERAAKGEIGEVAPGQGLSTADLVQRGLRMSPEKVTEAVSRVVQGGDIPVDDAAAIRGEEARLSQRSNQLSRAAQDNPNSVEAKLAADNAFKDLTDFHNGPVAQLKENWANQGRAMQGEIPVDLSTFNGLREQWLRDTGEAPPAKVEPTLRRTAENVSKAVTEENGARSRLAQEIEKQTTRSKLPTSDEVRNNIRERLGLEPCR